MPGSPKVGSRRPCGAARAVTGLRDGGEPGHRNVGTALFAIAEAARRRPGGRVVDVDQRAPGSGYLSLQPLKLWLGADKGVADAFGSGAKGQGQLSTWLIQYFHRVSSTAQGAGRCAAIQPSTVARIWHRQRQSLGWATWRPGPGQVPCAASRLVPHVAHQCADRRAGLRHGATPA